MIPLTAVHFRGRVSMIGQIVPSVAFRYSLLRTSKSPFCSRVVLIVGVWDGFVIVKLTTVKDRSRRPRSGCKNLTDSKLY